MSLSPSVRSIVRAAQRAVKAAAPKATTEVPCEGKPPRSKSAMWKLYRYTLDDVDGYVAAIGAFTNHASIFFPHGAELEDVDGILEGTGKQFRYITLRTAADAEHPKVKRVIRAAFRDARARARAD